MTVGLWGTGVEGALTITRCSLVCVGSGRESGGGCRTLIDEERGFITRHRKASDTGRTREQSMVVPLVAGQHAYDP